MTYDPTTDAGKVRLLCIDTDVANEIFSDAEIDTFLELSSSSVLIAGAMALETIARSQVLVLKVIKLLDLQTDGASVARELRMSAGVLRQQAAEGLTLDYAENPVDVFSLREKTIKDELRGLL